MALIKCPECGKEVSGTCDVCIHCGYKLKNESDIAYKPTNLQKNNDVIAYRLKNRSKYASVALLLLFGAIFVVFFTILVSKYGFSNSGFVFCNCLFLLGAVFSFSYSVYFLILILHNNSNPDNCITYNRVEHMLALTTIHGKKIKVSPRQYINVRCNNFTTDNILVFYYKNERGYSKKVKLGWTLNPPLVKTRLIELSKNDCLKS